MPALLAVATLAMAVAVVVVVAFFFFPSMVGSLSYGAKILNLAPINLYYMGDAFRPSAAAGLYALLSSFGWMPRPSDSDSETKNVSERGLRSMGKRAQGKARRCRYEF